MTSNLPCTTLHHLQIAWTVLAEAAITEINRGRAVCLHHSNILNFLSCLQLLVDPVPALSWWCAFLSYSDWRSRETTQTVGA